MSQEDDKDRRGARLCCVCNQSGHKSRSLVVRDFARVAGAAGAVAARTRRPARLHNHETQSRRQAHKQAVSHRAQMGLTMLSVPVQVSQLAPLLHVAHPARHGTARQTGENGSAQSNLGSQSESRSSAMGERRRRMERTAVSGLLAR